MLSLLLAAVLTILPVGGDGAQRAGPALRINGPAEADMAQDLATRLAGTWRIVAVDEADLIPGLELTLVFGPDLLGGFSGCNNFSFRIDYSGADALSLAYLQSGQQVCSPDVQGLEQAILSAIASSGRVAFDGEDRITLYMSDIAVIEAERQNP